MAGVAAYPGSFNPPTVAHLAIAEAALHQGGLDRVELVVSRRALGKTSAPGPDLEDRLAVLQAISARRPWLAVRATDAQLIAEVAAGYDAVIVGTDKWAQIIDLAWYEGSALARDDAVARLPRLLLAPRSLDAGPEVEWPAGAQRLDLAARHLAVSSSAVRTGRREWMAAEAAAFDRDTGAWSDTGRYLRWRASRSAHQEEV